MNESIRYTHTLRDTPHAQMQFCKNLRVPRGKGLEIGTEKLKRQREETDACIWAENEK